MGALADRAFSATALQAAWEGVQANDLEDGVPSRGVTRFAEDVAENLAQLREQLASDGFQASDLVEVQIRVGEKRRTLHIPAARDRVVARAVLTAVTPVVDPGLGHGAFAYRPGLGVADAVRAVAALRDEGLRFALRTDIKDCFPSIPRELALEQFADLVSDDAISAVVGQFGRRRYRAPTGGWRTLAGVPQGCPLSPVLANLVLRHLDSALSLEGFPVVRYGDDLLVAAASAADAAAADRLVRGWVERLGMEVNEQKTRVTSFDEGFTFLGEDFGPRYPPLLGSPPGPDSAERALYVGLQGCGLRLRDGRIRVVSKDDAEVLNVASSQVSRIVCFGSVGVSAGVRTWALANEVDVVLASRKGNYLGTMLGHSQRYRPARLRAQIEFIGGHRRIELCRAVIEAKLVKQKVLLQRFNRRNTHEAVSNAVESLSGLLRLLPDAAAPSDVMGVEGAAAHFYFGCLGQLVPEGLRFEGRSRQPPQDLINAALSYLYTILQGECVTALHAAGLDPALGVLHSDRERRASLALDLMEEFRPWLVDQVVLEAARQGRLRPEHGRREEGRGVLLTKEGKQVVVGAYEDRLSGTVRGALPEFSGSRRRHIHRQAQRLRASIMAADQPWTGLSWRP